MPATLRAKAWQTVDGVLLLDKPLGLTSNGALQTVRRLYAAAKAGHTGTLDPQASGLLPICLGEATKFSGVLLDSDKTYEAMVQLGIITTTGDAEGEIIARHPVEQVAPRIAAVLARLTGIIEQVPPMHSALKRNGRPLYEYARAGQVVERQARSVTIHSLDLIEMTDSDRLSLRVHCSKGTYVRVLAEDIGGLLGCGAHLCGLRRTRTGGFCIEHAVSLDALAAQDESRRAQHLLPVDSLLRDLPELKLDAVEAAAIRQGRKLSGAWSTVAAIRLYDKAGGFLGLGEVDGTGLLAPRRLLASAVQSKAAAQSFAPGEAAGEWAFEACPQPVT